MFWDHYLKELHALVRFQDKRYSGLDWLGEDEGFLLLEPHAFWGLCWKAPGVSEEALNRVQEVLAALLNAEVEGSREATRWLGRVQHAIPKLYAASGQALFLEWAVRQGFPEKKPSKGPAHPTAWGEMYRRGYDRLSLLRGNWKSFAGKRYREFYLDGDHPWKNLKYRHLLEGLWEGQKSHLEPLMKQMEKQEGSLLWERSFLSALKALKESRCYGCARDQYLDVWLNVRDGVDRWQEQPQRAPSSQQGLFNLCEALYGGVSLLDFGEKLVRFMAEKGGEQVWSAPPRFEELSFEEQCECLDEVPQELLLPTVGWGYQKYRGAIGLDFDGPLMGNAPYLWGELQVQGEEGKEQRIKMMRGGSAVIWDKFGEARATPELQGMLEGYSRKGKRHLIFSLLDYQPQLPIVGDDKDRWRALLRLEEEYPRSFTACVLAQDSDFANQVGAFGKRLSVSEYATHFVQCLTKNQEGYFFPKQWHEDPYFQGRMQQIVEMVAQMGFTGRSWMTVEDQRVFKELVDGWVTYFVLLEYARPDSFWIGGNTALDRGTKNSSLFLRLLAATLGKEKELCYPIDVLTHSTRLFARKMEAKPIHRRQLVEGTRYMERERARLVAMAQKMEEVSWGKARLNLVGLNFPRGREQFLLPSKEQAKNLLESELADHKEELELLLQSSQIWKGREGRGFLDAL